MTTERAELNRNRLTCFFYLLTRDTLPWGELHRLIDEARKSDDCLFTSDDAAALAEAAVIRLLGEEPKPVDTRTLSKTPDALRMHLAAGGFSVEVASSYKPVYPPGQIDRIELVEGTIISLYASGKALVQGVGPLGVVRELVRENGWSVSG